MQKLFNQIIPRVLPLGFLIFSPEGEMFNCHLAVRQRGEIMKNRFSALLLK